MEEEQINPLIELFKASCIIHYPDSEWEKLECILLDAINKRSEEIDFSHNINEQKDFLK